MKLKKKKNKKTNLKLINKIKIKKKNK